MNLLDRAAKAPVRLLVLLVVGIIALTAVVATERHRPADAAGADTTAPAAASPDSGAVGHDRRSAPVSRSSDRRADRPQRVRHASRIARKPPTPAKPAKPSTPARPATPQLPAAPLDAAQMVAAAKSSTTNVPGQCLSWSRAQADIPSRYGDAAGAWSHAAGRHPGDADPPKGAAVYWTGGSIGHGHVAISLGHGLVRSTDAGGSGVVATVPLRRLTRDWHLDYAGWASSINGYSIRGIAGA